MYRFSPFISQPLLPFFFAIVVNALASEPASVSVRAKAPVHSPDAILGKYLCFCSSVAKSNIAWDVNPIVVENRDLKTQEAWQNSNVKRTCCSIVKPKPPNSFGIDIPNSPMSLRALVRSSGMPPSRVSRFSAGLKTFCDKSRTEKRYSSKRVKLCFVNLKNLPSDWPLVENRNYDPA